MLAKVSKICLACGLVGLLFGVGGTAIADTLGKKEARVKAAFIFNFTKFVTWPRAGLVESNQNFMLCVLAPNPFGDVLNSFEQYQAQGRSIETRVINGAREVDGCHVLYIHEALPDILSDILAQCQKSGTLTVSDMPGFNRSGGIIRLLIRQNKVRFEVQLDAAQAAGLKISSQLLKLAQQVHGGKPQ